MKAVIIAGAAVVAVLLAVFAAGFIRLIWLSVPYEIWAEYEREKRQWEKAREQRGGRRKRGKE